MGQKSVKGSLELAKSIKLRRNKLNLTIEEAASRAGVGTKTWSRYESGESIRKDKCKGICKALGWHSLSEETDSNTNDKFDLNDYKKHGAWSPYLVEAYGTLAATSFVIGSDILLGNLREDMEALSSMPKGSHIGQINVSWLESSLPSQFLMRYDYDFLYILRHTVTQFRLQASVGGQLIAHSVIEELALYLIVEESRFLMETIEANGEFGDEDYDNWDEWIFNIFDDMDLVTFLYSNMYLTNDHTYHFDHWVERQFYCE